MYVTTLNCILSMNQANIHPDDRRYIDALKSGDVVGTREFFYEELRPVLSDIRRRVFEDAVLYDELVAELYLHLASGDWRRLDTFVARHDSRLRTWVGAVARRLFLAMRDVIYIHSGDHVILTSDSEPEDESTNVQAIIDVRKTLERMPNRRYAEILELLMLRGDTPEEAARKLNVTTANLYNLKRRAINQFISCFE